MARPTFGQWGHVDDGRIVVRRLGRSGPQRTDNVAYWARNVSAALSWCTVRGRRYHPGSHSWWIEMMGRSADRRTYCPVRILAALFLVLLVGSAVEAQIVKRARVFPFNFRNDVSQPLTLEQLRAAYAVWVPMTTEISYGAWSLEITVYPYVTVDQDKPANICTGIDGPKLTAAIATHGALPPMDIRVYVSPTTFFMTDCDSAGPGMVWNKNGLRNLPFQLVHAFGSGPIPVAAICKDAAGTYITLRPGSCVQNERNRMTYTGQGDGRPGAWETLRLGFLPAANVTTIASLAVGQSQRITIVPLEVKTTAIQWVHIQPMGLSFEYHQDGSSGGWQEGGLTGHRLQSSTLVDFTPDGKLWWPGQAGESALAVGKSYVDPLSKLRVTTLSATAGGAELYLDYEGAVLPGAGSGQGGGGGVVVVPPGCTTASPEGTRGAPITDPDCAVWTLGPATNWRGEVIPTGVPSILKNGARVWTGSDLWLCAGKVHVLHDDTRWYRSEPQGFLFVANIGTLPTACQVSVPPPAPTPQWTTIPGVVQQLGTQYRACDTASPPVCVVFVKP